MPSRLTHRQPLMPAFLMLAALSGCASGPTASVQAPQAATPPDAAASLQAPANPEALAEQRFAQWVTNFRATARAAGIDQATLDTAFEGVKLRPHAVVQDRSQPEFTRTLWDYLDGVVSAKRVAAGQDKLAELRPEANAATARHGVPGPVLMAVWGIESNYGANYGDVPVIDALATLGFEGRREAWARTELLAALKILQSGDISRERMIGSWAGAMGQTQFMPSSYLAYAVDADGDGRRDIWGSMADVLFSTANFLAAVGWRADEPWGVEVRLPADFDPGRADTSVKQASAQWSSEGVRTMDDTPLPAMADASILQPAGARGPAFMVGRNFGVILRYNNSTSYALTVGLLSQRIGGGPGVQAPWPRDLRALTSGEMKTLQTALNRLGFDSGTPDGQMGPATRKALRLFQRSLGQPADGFPTASLLAQAQLLP